MNLLKQTALVLGLVSLVIGGWAIYRHWRSKITFLFSLFCFMISIWALSFVSHVTLGGRLSYDIHLFCNVWLVPVAISLLHQVLFKRKDRFSTILKWTSFAGAVVLGLLIAVSFPRPDWFQQLLFFYPLPDRAGIPLWHDTGFGLSDSNEYGFYFPFKKDCFLCGTDD